MSEELRILIAGDRFIKPQLVQRVVEERLSDTGYTLRFRSIEYPYPVEAFPLSDRTSAGKTGGAWDGTAPASETEPHSRVTEYYGGIDSLVGELADTDLLLVHMAPVTRVALDGALDLKLIACCRGGPHNVDVDAATERGIPVINTPGRNAVAVAEFTIGLLISHVRRIADGHHGLQQGRWKIDVYHDRYVGPELRGRTAGIIGLGNIGREVAVILRAFGVHVCGHDPYVEGKVFRPLKVERLPLHDLLKRSDFVLLCARLTSENAGMIGARELAMMKPNAYFISTARGGLVDYDALRQALSEERIAGAALDVYDQEPLLQDDPLLTMSNVTLTPHVAGASADVVRHSCNMLAADVRRFLQGRPLRHCANPTAYRPRQR
jgi:D-3-phosphoglycerate dehydrogenase